MYWNVNDKERLIGAFKFARDDNAIKSLLADLLSPKEIKTLEMRLKVACLVHDCAPYSHIQKISGMSSKTIAEISKRLVDKRGGFRETIRRFKEGGHSYGD